MVGGKSEKKCYIKMRLLQNHVLYERSGCRLKCKARECQATMYNKVGNVCGAWCPPGGQPTKTKTFFDVVSVHTLAGYCAHVLVHVSDNVTHRVLQWCIVLIGLQ